ncbi:hypothetical protein FSP39_015008 [Pinctada imbricata]|uniref:Ionotropic glutamate receptor C-terminal domain-containing protein n=1 Tax=Pinctada imbricata TaxID=66713 RepID=A0AA89C010_PINIB|nr:hypothetical protein FSP39_015008 [Pinctada imbricata]
MLLVVCMVMGILYGAINHFSPSEWSKVPPDEDKTNSRESFTPKNAGFFVHSTLNWQGYKEVPRSPGGRFLTTMWFSFVSFLIYGYSANLVSILVNRPPNQSVIPHKSFRSMIQDVKVDAKTTMSSRDLESLFMASVDRDLPVLYEKVSGGFVTSGSVEKDDMNLFDSLSQSEMSTVLVTPSSVAKYRVRNKCDLISSDSFLKLQYAFCARRDNTGIINLINAVILRMIEEGKMEGLIKRWMPSDSCDRNLGKILVSAQIPVSTARPLSLADLAVPYIMLLVGVIVSIIMLIVETCLHRRRQRQNESNTEPIVMTTTNGGASKTEGGADDEKVPMAADEP